MATGWLTEADIEDYWPDALAEMSPAELAPLLASARSQCEDFAPTLPEDAVVPDTYRLAQAMQARALWRSVRASTGDTLGADGLSVTVFPLDWNVKALLRPHRGRPRVGRGKKKETP